MRGRFLCVFEIGNKAILQDQKEEGDKLNLIEATAKFGKHNGRRERRFFCY
jgi:hypothetical protein